jgi:diguanylate cyclase (GGDEF)-like protein
MTGIRGPLARIERSRDELAKAWLVRLIERATLDEIRELPTDRIARELPELISDVVRAVARDNGNGQVELSSDQVQRAAALAAIRQGSGASAAELTRDLASLQTVLMRALREETGEDTEEFAATAEHLVDAVGAVQAAAVEEHVRSRSRELESQANTDALTGLYNLRYVQGHIAQLLDFQRRYGHPFGLLLMDIDGLKRINDAHGHAAGDRVLLQVAMSIRRSIRSVDTPARLGGDEFCVLAPNQDAGHARTLGQRLAAAITEQAGAPETPPIGISIGVVSCPEHGEEAEVLMDLADRAMYRAKASGESVALAEAADVAVAEEAKPR